MFADGLTIGKLVGNLTKSMKGRWFHYQAGNLSRPEKVSFEAWFEQERKTALQQRQCTLAAKNQAAQGPETALANSAHKCKKYSGREDAVPKRNKPGAPGVLEAPRFGIEARTDHLRWPLCGNQRGYTGSNGLIRLSTRLEDCEVGYRNMSEEDSAQESAAVCLYKLNTDLQKEHI